MATVADIIRDVRDHPEGDPYRNTTDAAILRFLNRYVPQLSLEITKYRPDLQQVTEAIALSTYDFDTGHSISASFEVPIGGEVVFDSADLEPDALQLVPFVDRHSRRYKWGAYLDGTTLHLLGTDTYWNGVTRVDLLLQKRPTALAARTDSIDLPGDPTDALVAQAVAWAMPAYAAFGLEAERLYLNRVTGRDRAQVYIPRLT